MHDRTSRIWVPSLKRCGAASSMEARGGAVQGIPERDSGLTWGAGDLVFRLVFKGSGNG
jgi:hypothetical protein